MRPDRRIHRSFNSNHTRRGIVHKVFNDIVQTQVFQVIGQKFRFRRARVVNGDRRLGWVLRGSQIAAAIIGAVHFRGGL